MTTPTTPATRRRRAGFAALLLAGSSLGGFAFWHGTPALAQTQPPVAVLAPSVAQANFPGFADLVQRVRPAVVTITTTERAPQGDTRSPFPSGSEQDRMFHRFFGGQQQGRGPMHALGSGFLIDSEGHIVTNNHVVQGATAVRVTLDDGREMAAQVVGRDPRTDLALLKVDGTDLPHLTLGDSNRARPGDWVVALGNPFGLGGTVTAGVVSARGRNIGEGPYDDFLQIDAPINQGNSGGPLFALDGTVIGVNTAIFSPNGGGSVGIGFAIPSDMVKTVVAQLEANGRVERGFLGASTQTITPALAQAMRLPSGNGALVASVQPDSPAARAGLRSGDVVTGLNGQPVADSRALARDVGGLRPGSAVTLSVTRDGKPQDMNVTLAALQDKSDAAPGAAAQDQRGAVGIALAPLDEGTREQLNVPRDVRGAVIAAVRPDSAAAEAGLKRGDVVTAVGGHDVANPEAAVRAIRDGLRGGKPVAMRILREGQGLFVAVAPNQG